MIYGYRRFNHLGRGLCREPGVGHLPPSTPCRSPPVTTLSLYYQLSHIRKYCMFIACVASYMSHLSSCLSNMTRYSSYLSNMIRYSTNSTNSIYWYVWRNWMIISMYDVVLARTYKFDILKISQIWYLYIWQILQFDIFVFTIFDIFDKFAISTNLPANIYIRACYCSQRKSQ